MSNRREFLQSGVSVSSVPLALNILLPSLTASADCARVPIHKAVVDDRYSEGNAFAAALAQCGVAVKALDNGDVTSFWYDEMDTVWRKGAAAIAGLTQFGPMFVLEQLARERGMRVAVAIAHKAQADGTMAHEISGPPEVIELAQRLRQRGVHWPALAAVLSAYCPAERSSQVTCSLVTDGAAPAPRLSNGLQAAETVIHYYTSAAIRDGWGVPWDGPLYSWLIAPASAA